MVKVKYHYGREQKIEIIKKQFTEFADFDIDSDAIEKILSVIDSMTFSMLKQMAKALQIISKGK